MHVDPNDKYPIDIHSSCNIVDTTKLNDFMACPRMFFFKYALGWNKQSNHLVFGKAWHEAMEHLLIYGYESTHVVGAFKAFMDCYSKDYTVDEYEDYHPKTPMRAMQALIEYVNNYKYDHNEFSVVELDSKKLTEIAGSVYLTDEHLLYFRMDAVCEEVKGKFALEHKTGSSSYMWADQWDLAMQVFTYLYVLYCMYNASDVSGIKINGVIFKKTASSKQKDAEQGLSRNFDFIRPHIYRTPSQIEAWMIRTNYHMSMMQYHFDMLKDDDPAAKVMKSFPMVTTSCTRYLGCEYKDFCKAFDNPLKHAVRGVPIGWNQKFWDPTEGEINIKLGTLKL